MWEHTLVVTTDVPIDALWAVVADVPNWPAWQPGVDRVDPSADGRSAVVWGTAGATRVDLDDDAPYHLTVTAPLPLARVRTEYAVARLDSGTRVRVSVCVTGPLGFLHARRLGRPDARTSALVRRLIGRARLDAGVATGAGTGGTVHGRAGCRFDRIPIGAK